MALKIRKSVAPKLCPVGACMQVLGGAWAPQIIWRLSGGPRRFGELKIDIPAISPKMLSTRLKDFEDKGVVSRKVVATTPVSVEYELTGLGRDLVPVIEKIAEVGAKMQAREAPARPDGQTRSAIKK